MFNLTAEQADQMSNSLGRLDKCAKLIEDNHEKWGMPFEAAKQIVNALDQSADEIERFTFGEDSLRRRQAEVVQTELAKEAKVHQRDADEGYMDSFQSDMGVVKHDADEGYMSAYRDDQSSSVARGRDETGRPLAPGHG